MTTMGHGLNSRVSSENTIEISPLIKLKVALAGTSDFIVVSMYSTVRGLIQFKKQLLDTPGQVLSYQFDPITLSPTEELYWDYTPTTSTAGNTFSQWDIIIAGSTAAVSQQSWPKYNKTTLGLIPEIVSTQEEFYDGEYSGRY